MTFHVCVYPLALSQAALNESIKSYYLVLVKTLNERKHENAQRIQAPF